jgi:hypothetical protein
LALEEIFYLILRGIERLAGDGTDALFVSSAAIKDGFVVFLSAIGFFEIMEWIYNHPLITFTIAVVTLISIGQASKK